jgi:hypothetical protein
VETLSPEKARMAEEAHKKAARLEKIKKQKKVQGKEKTKS